MQQHMGLQKVTMQDCFLKDATAETLQPQWSSLTATKFLGGPTFSLGLLAVLIQPASAYKLYKKKIHKNLHLYIPADIK